MKYRQKIESRTLGVIDENERDWLTKQINESLE
jgi:hypothetical protein